MKRRIFPLQRFETRNYHKSEELMRHKRVEEKRHRQPGNHKGGIQKWK